MCVYVYISDPFDDEVLIVYVCISDPYNDEVFITCVYLVFQTRMMMRFSLCVDDEVFIVFQTHMMMRFVA